jgi:hypothetical protein
MISFSVSARAREEFLSAVISAAVLAEITEGLVLLIGYEPQSPANPEVADRGDGLLGSCVDRFDHSVGSWAWRCRRIFLAHLQSLFPFLPSLPQLDATISPVVACLHLPLDVQQRGDRSAKG